MNALDPAFCVRLVATLAHFLWQALAIALAAGLASLALRRASAQWRYAVLVAALALMVGAPVATYLALAPAAVPAPAALSAAAPPSAPLAPVPTAPAVTPFVSPEPLTNHAPVAAAPREAEPVSWTRFAPHLALVYFAGVSLMLLRLLVGLYGGGRMRRMSEPVSDAEILGALSRMAKSIGLRFTPAVAFCRNVAAPTVIGVLRPVVLLPLTFATGLTSAQVEAVLAHELEHIRRYDYLVNLLQRVIESAFFFHPAVWWVSRRIRIEREHCCDDAVLAAGAFASAYAESLVILAERSRALRGAPLLARVAALGAMDKPSPLKARVLRLLGRTDGEPVRLVRAWPVAVLLLGAVLLAASLVVRTCAAPADDLPVPELRFISRGHEFGADAVTGEPTVRQECWLPNGDRQDRKEDRRFFEQFQFGLSDRPRSGKVRVNAWLVFAPAPAGEEYSASIALLDAQGEPLGAAGSFGLLVGDEFWHVHLADIAQERLLLETDIRVRYAQGSWKDVAAVRLDGTVEGRLPGGLRVDRVGVDEFRRSHDGLRDRLAYVRLGDVPLPEELGLELGCRAVMKDGTSRHASGTGEPDNKGLSTFVLDLGVKLDDVKEFRVLTRPWKTITFKNVSLKPGHRTDFKAEAETANAPGAEKSKPPLATLATLTAHRFYEQGKPVRVRFETKASAWKPTMDGFYDKPMNPTYFVRIDGKDYSPTMRWGPFGNENNAGFSENEDLGAITGANLKFSLGKHRACFVYKGVDAVDTAAPGKLVHYDELTTNEVEFEVVEKLPEGYLKPVFEAGWDALLKEKLESRLTDRWDEYATIIENNYSLDHPDLLWMTVGALPFDSAFDVYAEPEGGDRRKVGVLSRQSGGLSYRACFHDDRLTWENAKERKWRLVFVPSAEVAAENPPITTYYGREFASDWLTFTPSKSYDKTMARRKEFLAAKAAEPAWGVAVEGVQVRLRVDKAQWKTGETTTFKADFRNAGDRNLFVMLVPLLPPFWEMELDGRSYRGETRFEGRVPTRPLQPGRTINDVAIGLDKDVRWRSEVGDKPFQLTPGKHTIRLVFIAHTVLGDEDKPVRVISNPVEIEILPEKVEEGANAAWGEAVEGVQVRLRSDKAQWKAGETPTFKFDARNQGKRNLSFDMHPKSFDLQMDGRRYIGTGIITAWPIPKDLGPGSELDGLELPTYSWYGWSEEHSPFRFLQFQYGLGKHKLRVVLILNERDSGKELRVVSNPVEIEILPAEAKAVPALVKALGNLNSSVRANAAWVLGTIGPEAKEAVPALIGALTDPDAQARRDAARALGEIGPEAKQAIPELERLAENDPDQAVRQFAREALEKIRK